MQIALFNHLLDGQFSNHVQLPLCLAIPCSSYWLISIRAAFVSSYHQPSGNSRSIDRKIFPFRSTEFVPIDNAERVQSHPGESGRTPRVIPYPGHGTRSPYPPAVVTLIASAINASTTGSAIPAMLALGAGTPIENENSRRKDMIGGETRYAVE